MREARDRRDDLVIGNRDADLTHLVEQRRERRTELLLVAGVDRRDQVVVELVERPEVAVVDAPLAFAENPDDHFLPSSAGAGWACASGSACCC
jgi:hypothetical protein